MADNYTQFPNWLLNEIIGSDLSSGEIKILLFIIRKTFGYHKRKDKISYSQIAKKCNTTRRSAIRSVSNLEEKGLISVTKCGTETNEITILASDARVTSKSTASDTHDTSASDARVTSGGGQLVTQLSPTKETNSFLKKKAVGVADATANQPTKKTIPFDYSDDGEDDGYER